MAAHFTLRTIIDAPPAMVFAASLDVEEHLRSMSGSNETAVGGVTTGRLGPGEVVTWRARHFGVVWTMTSRITVYEPPSRFVDEQEHGPFRSFRHVHLFRAAAGGTEMVDEVDLCAPFGRLGAVVESVVLERYLRRLIAHRNAYLKASLEGGGRSDPSPTAGN